MNRSTPGLPVHHQFLEFTQTHIHQVKWRQNTKQREKRENVTETLDPVPKGSPGKEVARLGSSMPNHAPLSTSPNS